MKILRAGILQLQYENGFLRYLRLGDVEVLRMIYFAVRDENWNTIPLIISHEQSTIYDNHFAINYEGRCQHHNIDWSWECKIIGSPHSSITFEIHGKAHDDFLRNRIGFCVLHPIQAYAGQPVWITHSDPNEMQAVFPDLISPYQPFKDVRAMRWDVAGTTASIHLFGDIFETEDQRNWLDASFKTYCTPLHLPLPAAVKKEDKVHQIVTFEILQNAENQIIEQLNLSYTLTETRAAYPIPPLGLQANQETLDAISMAHLKVLQLTFLRIEMRLHEADWEAGFKKQLQQAKALTLPIQLVLFLNTNWEIEKYYLHHYDFEVEIYSIILVDVNKKTIGKTFLQQVLPVLQQIFKNIPIGGGTDAYFTEFNRAPPPTELLNFVSFSVNPQVHAFDDLSLIENLEAPSHIIKSAKNLADLPVSVSPITLRPRFNPDAKAPEKIEVGKIPFRVDPRQRLPFCAVWTLGSILAFTKTDVMDLTYYQTVGEEGILMPNRDTQYEDFEAVAQEIFPVYEIFKLFTPFKNGTLETLQSSQPLIFDGFVLKKEQKKQLILLNYTSENITIQAFNKNYSLTKYQILVEELNS